MNMPIVAQIAMSGTRKPLRLKIQESISARIAHRKNSAVAMSADSVSNLNFALAPMKNCVAKNAITNMKAINWRRRHEKSGNENEGSDKSRKASPMLLHGNWSIDA
jgi:hypothetical protein